MSWLTVMKRCIAAPLDSITRRARYFLTLWSNDSQWRLTVGDFMRSSIKDGACHGS